MEPVEALRTVTFMFDAKKIALAIKEFGKRFQTEQIITDYDVAKELEKEGFIPKDTWYFFALSMYWYNDMDNWADTVLADKPIDSMFFKPEEKEEI